MDGVAVDGVARELLEDDRSRGVVVDREVDHGAGAREHVPERAVVDLERDRLLAAAVEHAGNEPGPAQAARRPRARWLTSGNGECGGL